MGLVVVETPTFNLRMEISSRFPQLMLFCTTICNQELILPISAQACGIGM